MRSEIICIFVAALTWGGYPLIARSTAIGTPLGALLLTASALLPITVATAWTGSFAKPQSSELLKLALAGILMGIGTTAFNFVVNSRRLDASISIPIVDTAMLIVSVVGAVLFFAEPVTMRKVVGIALLIGGIFVLKPE